MSNLKEHFLIQQYILWNEFGRVLGMHFEIPEPGKVIYEMTVGDMHLATPFAAHGGSVASLMDAALGVASLSAVCEGNRIVSTVSLNMQFLNPALNGDHLTAVAEVTKSGQRLVFVEAKITNQKGQLIAAGSATMNAYPLEKALKYQKD